MPEEKQPSVFSASDIRRYAAGEMTAAEMHALESAAARDPFLAEALEGYTSLPADKWEEPLAELHARFGQQQSNKVYRMRYMKAAAAIVLLGLSVAIAYLFTTKETVTNTELAVNTQPEKISNDSNPVQTPAETNTPPPAAEQHTSTPQPAAASTKPAPVTAKTAQTGSDSSFVYRPSPVNAAPPLQNLPSTAVADEIAADSRANNAEILSRETTGNVALNEVIITSGNNNQVNRNPQAAVSNADISNRKKTLPAAESIMKDRADHEKKTVSNPGDAEPVSGWEQFRLYLEKEKRTPEVVRRDKITGPVMLTLHLLSDGRIEKIDVTRSLHPDCDAEAVRLIREGPAWKINTGLKSASVQVSVQF